MTLYDYIVYQSILQKSELKPVLIQQKTILIFHNEKMNCFVTAHPILLVF